MLFKKERIKNKNRFRRAYIWITFPHTTKCEYYKCPVEIQHKKNMRSDICELCSEINEFMFDKNRSSFIRIKGKTDYTYYLYI